MALVSVIVPVYNVEKYLHKCIDSILAQTFTDFELIIVDDGSTDSSGRICDEYGKIDNRVYVIHQENQGASCARNIAIEWVYANSNSSWICFIDSDDFVHAEYLQILWDTARHFSVKLVQCKASDFIDGELAAERIETYCDGKIVAPDDIYALPGSIVPMRKIIHKDLMRNIRLEGKINEDEFTMYKVFFAVEKMASIDSELYYYRIRKDSISHSKWTYRNMNVFNAYEDQLHFFLQIDNERMYALTLDRYLNNLIQQFTLSKNATDADCNATKHIVRRIRSLIILELIHHRGIPLNKYPRAYELAFPKTMWVYWAALAQVKKLKRR